LSCKYDPKFAVRGLYFDIQKGNLLKIDMGGSLQIDSIYCGRHKLSPEQCATNYPGLHIPRKYIESLLRPMSDLYCLPEGNLF
jgi:hypothetical protein